MHLLLLTLASEFTLGMVFVVAATSKLRSRRAFREFVGSVPGRDRPRLPAFLLASAVVVGEVVVACTLLIGRLIDSRAAIGGLTLAGGLLVAFTMAQLTALRRGEHTSCRCFGASRSNAGWPQVIRNAGLAGIVGLGLAGHAVAAGPTDSATAATATALAVALASFVVRFDDVAALMVSGTRARSQQRAWPT